MTRSVHQFDNGLRVFDDHLTRWQRERYVKRNVHEAEEEDLFVRIVQGLPEAGCFLNIGAAVGYYVMLAKKLAPRLVVYAVEPLEQHRAFFAENLRLNGLGPADCTLYCEAVANVRGAAQLLEQDYGSMLLCEGAPLEPSQATLKQSRVATLTLDDLSAHWQVAGPPDDGRAGAGSGRLRGGAAALRGGKVKTLLIGTHGQEVHRACLEILRTQGFAIAYDNPTPASQPDGIIHASKVDHGGGF